MSKISPPVREKYYWLTEKTLGFLKKGYLLPGQTVEERINLIAQRAEKLNGIPGFAERVKYHLEMGNFSLSSPMWSNFGTNRGLPISCFGTSLEDDLTDIFKAKSEIGEQSRLGGGTSITVHKLRPRGTVITDNGESSGSVHFLKDFESTVKTVSQGGVRRGYLAAYTDADHGDFDEFIRIGGENSDINYIKTGVAIDDSFMDRVYDGEEEASERFIKIMSARGNNGFPYVLFKDNVRRGMPDCYKDTDQEITHSNLCSEIMLPDGPDESFVCVLLSMNFLNRDQWKDTDAIEVAVFLLDAVITESIEKLEEWKNHEDPLMRDRFNNMKRTHKFLVRHRAIGLGALGWHSYLQERMIPFESKEASKLNVEFFKDLKVKSYAASAKLAEIFGECEMTKGYGRRNATLNAIAPTVSSAFILGEASNSIEPFYGNMYFKELAKAKVYYENPVFVKLLKSKGKYTREIIKSVTDSGGSCQHLDFLTDEEKEAFKTGFEMNQFRLIDQQALRGVYIDQGTSLNLFRHADITGDEFAQWHTYAWKMGVKSLYYTHSTNAAKVYSRNNIECKGCEA